MSTLHVDIFLYNYCLSVVGLPSIGEAMQYNSTIIFYCVYPDNADIVISIVKIPAT